jgi:hypothetical protein
MDMRGYLKELVEKKLQKACGLLSFMWNYNIRSGWCLGEGSSKRGLLLEIGGRNFS